MVDGNLALTCEEVIPTALTVMRKQFGGTVEGAERERESEREPATHARVAWG